MPFTPYHMGPGLLIKATLRTAFSLTVFGWSQILIDLQPLISLTTGIGQVHGFSHTYMGAALIGLVAAITGKPLSDLGFRILKPAIERVVVTRWRVAIVSALIGTYSHVALDSLMHGDMQPFAPLSARNPTLRLISPQQVVDWCVYLGMIGALLYTGITLLVAKRSAHAKPDSANTDSLGR